MKCFYDVVRLGVLLALSCLVSPVAAAQPDREIAARADALLQDYVRDELFSGTILVARNGKPIFRKGYGAANREWMIPNTVNTRYRIGSVTKHFTAAAILRLVDEGKLSLDDPIGKHLTELPDSWNPATLRQLLAHSSGIPSHTAAADSDASMLPVKHSPQQLVDLVRNTPLIFAHGARFSYNNMGYVLLGRVIETVSGMPYADYIEQRLLKPLKLRDTAYDDGRGIVPRLAQDYTDGKDAVVKGRAVHMSNAYAAGALVSSVDDLLAWQQTLINGKVLGESSLKAMLTDHGHRYGFGWFIRNRLSRTVVEHGGAIGAYSSLLAYYPADKVTIIVLANYGEEVVSKISDELARLALGLAPARRQAKANPMLYPQLAGQYQLGASVLAVRTKDGRLFARLTGQRELEIVPESDVRYFYKAVDVLLTFERDAAGKVDAVTVHQDGDKMTARRIQ